MVADSLMGDQFFIEEEKMESLGGVGKRRIRNSVELRAEADWERVSVL
jgi:hypothetical protein